MPHAGVVWLLEDSEHVYLQANAMWEPGDDYPFKLVSPLQPLLDQGILAQQIISGKSLERVFVLDDRTMERLSGHRSMRGVANVLERVDVRLP